MNVNSKYQQNLEFRKRKIANRSLLYGFNKCFELNETAEIIWTNLDGLTSLDEIIHIIVAKFGCSYEQVKEDVFHFISFLTEVNAIESGVDE